MLTSQRKKLILNALQSDGEVVAKKLSERFGLSEDTIRRDLRELAAEGRLQRVHGGALPASAAVADMAHRRPIEVAGKRAIAKAAARMLGAGQVAIFDGGTTAIQLARTLPRELSATIVTHSPSIAVELVDHPHIDVILIGGRLFKHSMVTVGPAALEALASIRADWYFMGVTGVHAQAGLSTGDFDEAYMKRALVAHAAETVVLASNEKLNAASKYRIGEITLAQIIIVEPAAPAEKIELLAATGVTIVRA